MILSALVLGTTALAKPKVYTSVNIDLQGKTGLCPGEHQKLDLVTMDAAGKDSRVKFGTWKQFEITWDVGPVSTKGELAMPSDPRSFWGHPGLVSVKWTADPAVHAEAALAVRYDCPLEINRSGDTGPTGERGSNGATGADADGGDGQDGGDGADGGAGHEVEVKVTLVKEPSQGIDVLQLAVHDLTDDSTTFGAVAASGGSASIYANGGQGGQGGPGGAGGSGATARNGGDGGDGGDGGRGGSGGKITVIVDPSAKAHAGRISAVAGPGQGGQAGLPGDGGQAFDPGTPGAKGHEGHGGQPGVAGAAAVLKAGAVAPLW